MENPPNEARENHPLAGQEKALKMDLDETFTKKKKKKKKRKKGKIERTRVAQMMFKTALRNHLDLSSLADNKASTMLSVNTLIITIALPFMVPKIEEYPVLALPAAILLTTCIISIVFATLVTRPGKMGGITSEESLKQGKGDLFFFGNFFKMTYDQYQKGIRLTIDNDEHLDSMVMIDLFFSGKALGVKYTRLRYCYTVFIFGIIVSVIAALIGFLFTG